jgi:hypothetical protein
MANEYFEFNEQSCHGLPEFITGLTYQLPTGVTDSIFIDLNSIVSGFYKNIDNTRNPNLLNISNLPNNVFYDTGSKYLQGYLQDEGTYHIKTHIIESGILCEKTIVLNVIDTGVKHLYKINYPINIGFIKYNAPQRLGL